MIVKREWPWIEHSGCKANNHCLCFLSFLFILFCMSSIDIASYWLFLWIFLVSPYHNDGLWWAWVKASRGMSISWNWGNTRPSLVLSCIKNAAKAHVLDGSHLLLCLTMQRTSKVHLKLYGSLFHPSSISSKFDNVETPWGCSLAFEVYSYECLPRGPHVCQHVATRHGITRLGWNKHRDHTLHLQTGFFMEVAFQEYFA